jgi:hypothetical protein
MVSALLMAWLMENNASPPHVRAAENWHLVPVVNIARQSMHNHKDAAWLFDACGVDAHALLFADEVKKFPTPSSSLVRPSLPKPSIVPLWVAQKKMIIG